MKVGDKFQCCGVSLQKDRHSEILLLGRGRLFGTLCTHEQRQKEKKWGSTVVHADYRELKVIQYTRLPE